MADLNARTDTFVELVLNVSGRARVSDLADMMPPDAALALLQAYKAAHPELPLFFDGDALVYGVPASEAVQPLAAPVPYGVPAAVDVPPAAPAPPVAPAAVVGAADFAAEVPAPVDSASASVPAEELPSWYFEDGSGVPTAPLDVTPPAPADLGMSAEYAAPDDAAAAVQSTSQPPMPGDTADFVDLPAGEFAMPGDGEAGSEKPKRTRVLIYALVAVLVIAVLAAAAYVVFFGGSIPTFG